MGQAENEQADVDVMDQFKGLDGVLYEFNAGQDGPAAVAFDGQGNMIRVAINGVVVNAPEGDVAQSHKREETPFDRISETARKMNRTLRADSASNDAFNLMEENDLTVRAIS